MFAIIKTGGKQYKVSANDIIRVEKLIATSGDMVEFKDVLMMGQDNSVQIGAPTITNARVCATVLDQIRDDKVIIFKKKRRHNYRRKNGHRQYLTVVKITDILAEGQSPKKVAETPKVQTKKPAEKLEAKTAKVATPKSEVKAATPVKKAAPKATKSTSKTIKTLILFQTARKILRIIISHSFVHLLLNNFYRFFLEFPLFLKLTFAH